MGKLTAIAFKNATKPGRYQDGDGLILVVKASGSRSWLLRVQLDGERRDFGMGSASVVGLAEAREKAARYRKIFKEGGDPAAQEKAERLAKRILPTFKEAATSAHGELVAGWNNKKHRADWLSSLERYAFDKIGDKRIDQIDMPAVRDVLLPVWLERPETARRVKQRVKAVLDWSVGKGFRKSLDLSGLTLSLPKQPKSDNHFAAMPYEDVAAFVTRVKNDTETVGRLALLFTILTAARSGETRGATWKEIDFEAREWNIPASRMKAGVAHIVPLSGAAIAVLERAAELGRKSDKPVFPGRGGKPLSDMTISKIMRDMEAPYTVHGFRSSFKDWAVESTGFPDAVSEAALAHGDPDKVRAAYRRTDFRKMRVDLMAAWGKYICANAKADNIVQFGAVG